MIFSRIEVVFNSSGSKFLMDPETFWAQGGLPESKSPVDWGRMYSALKSKFHTTFSKFHIILFRELWTQSFTRCWPKNGAKISQKWWEQYSVVMQRCWRFNHHSRRRHYLPHRHAICEKRGWWNILTEILHGDHKILLKSVQLTQRRRIFGRPSLGERLNFYRGWIFLWRGFLGGQKLRQRGWSICFQSVEYISTEDVLSTLHHCPGVHPVNIGITSVHPGDIDVTLK